MAQALKRTGSELSRQLGWRGWRAWLRCSVSPGAGRRPGLT